MLIVRLFTAQNTIHLEFNFSLLIFDKINYDRDCVLSIDLRLLATPFVSSNCPCKL